MPEKSQDRHVTDWNLHSILSGWKVNPDEEDRMVKMQQAINECSRNEVLSLMVKKEVLRSGDVQEAFVANGTAKAYGREEGDLIIFDTGKIKARVGEIAGKGYLFLEKDGQRIGYMRPDYVAEIKVKK